VIKRWTRLVHGLRIRQRLQDQYADKPQVGERHWLDTQARTTETGGAEEVSREPDSWVALKAFCLLRRISPKLEDILLPQTMWSRLSIYPNTNTLLRHILPIPRLLAMPATGIKMRHRIQWSQTPYPLSSMSWTTMISKWRKLPRHNFKHERTIGRL